jgi:hypothetical protein
MLDFLKNKEYKVWILLFLGIILASILLNLGLYLTTGFETTITVSNKYIRTTRRSSRYHVVDKKGENFRVDNNMFKGDFNRGDDYGKLEDGKKYKVKGYGIRVPVLNMYRKIYSIEKV